MGALLEIKSTPVLAIAVRLARVTLPEDRRTVEL